MITSPMLASPVDFDKLKFPVLVTPKLDGIRCLTMPPKVANLDMFEDRPICSAVTRKFLPIPNRFVRNWIESKLPPGLDGELMLNGGTFQDVSSAFMSEHGEPKFRYHVFDYIGSKGELQYSQYHVRMKHLRRFCLCWDEVPILIPVMCKDMKELSHENLCYLANGHEGTMIRSVYGPYKQGRSTVNEGWLLKMKQFVDDEATVIGFEELTHNTNEKTKDNLGKAKRSTHRDSQVAGGTLGALVVQSVSWPEPFRIGTGFDVDTRRKLWEEREGSHSALGKLVKFKYQKIGTLTKPRCPVFLGFRDPRDL